MQKNGLKIKMKKAAIVLGGGLQKIVKDGKPAYFPHNQVISRLDKAYELFIEGNVDCIITTGNYSKRTTMDSGLTGPKTEAEVAILYLLEKFDKEKPTVNKSVKDYLLFENKSFDTLGNAWFTKKMCLKPNNIKSCIIITSDYHIERSEILFKWILGKDYKLETIALPTDFPEKNERIKLEKIFTDFINKWLVAQIPPGDDKAIDAFIKNEHIIYCLSERSQAFFEACLQTAAIKAGY